MDDITIVDLDLKRTTWSRVHSSMRTLHLRLSAEPDLDWIRLFREERESRVVIKRHGLWIEDGYLVFDCLLEDVQSHHLPDFRRSIDYANRERRSLAVQRARQVEQRADDARDEQRRLAELRASIRGAEAQPAAANAAPEAPLPGPQPASIADARFEQHRLDWRARFRAALTARLRQISAGGGSP